MNEPTSQLVRQARLGDADAFAELTRRYQNAALASAFALLRDFQLAQDAVQEALLSAHGALPRLADPAAFPGWLRGITRHQCHRLLRRGHFALRGLDAAADVADGEEPSRRVERDETRRAVLDAVAALPPAEREVVALFYLDERPQREVAAFLGVPVTTVNNRLHAARTKLKERMLREMGDTMQRNKLTEEFAERIGRIVRVRGPVVDVQFEGGALPAVLDAFALAEGSGPTLLAAELVQGPGGPTVRCLAPAGGGALRAGMKVVGRGEAGGERVGAGVVGEAIGVLARRPVGSAAVLETGIKVIDLLCPLVRGGALGIFGEAQAGKMALVEELLRRITVAQGGLSIFVFVRPDDVEAARRVPGGSTEAVQAFMLPSDEADEPTPASRDRLDTALYLSRELVTLGLFPAIDPSRSSSRALDPEVVGREHAEIAERARGLLGLALREPDSAAARRGRKLQRFLTQPLYVAEPYTKLPGASVPLVDTLAGCRAILDGAADDVADADLYMIGRLPA